LTRRLENMHLKVQPVLGRGFQATEGAEGASQVLVLQHDYWERRFLADRDVLGRVVTLDGQPYTIVGVMPEGFDFVPANVQAIRPSDFASAMQDRASRSYLAIGRLREDASAGGADLEAQVTHARVVSEFPEEMDGIELVVQPLRDFFLILFFFTVGAKLNIDLMLDVALPAVFVGVLLVAIKPIIFRGLLTWQGEPPAVAWEAGFRLGQTSEFSLLVAMAEESEEARPDEPEAAAKETKAESTTKTE